MAKKYARNYVYKCTITGEEFQTTASAPNPDELVSVKAYYQLHQEEDDRPDYIKKQLLNEEVLTPAPAEEASEKSKS